MLPYFIKLPELQLSKECMSRITNYVMSNNAIMNQNCIGPEFFERGVRLGNHIWNNDPELIKLENSIALPRAHRTLLHNHPGSNSVMHTDVGPGRVSILYFPIYPEPALYDRLLFWNKDPVNPVAEAGEDGVPFLFNATKLHGVPYINTHRINIQLSFRESLSDIVKLLKSDRFFIQ